MAKANLVQLIGLVVLPQNIFIQAENFFESMITNDAARGYNVFTGSRIPMSSAIDTGFKKQIFAFNVTSRKRFEVSGFQVFPQTICDAQFTQKEISSFESYNYLTTSSTSYSQSAPMGLFSASGSSEKKEATKKFEQEKKKLFASSAKCIVMLYYHSKSDPPNFTESFINSLLWLSDVYLTSHSGQQEVHERFFQLFDEFGTHFIERMSTGSKMTIHTFIKESEVNEYKSTKSTEKKELKTLVYSSSSTKKEDTESRKKTKKFTQDTRILTYGARPTVDNDIIEWASDVQFQPLPVEYDIISIDNVFNEYNYEKTFSLEKRRRNPKLAKIDREIWRRLTEDSLTALKEYCSARADQWGINKQDCLWTNVDQFSGKKSMFFSRETNSKTLDIFVIPSLRNMNKNPGTDQFDKLRKRLHTLHGCYNVLTDEWMRLSQPKHFRFPRESEWLRYSQFGTKGYICVARKKDVTYMDFDDSFQFVSAHLEKNTYIYRMDQFEDNSENRKYYLLADGMFEGDAQPFQIAVKSTNKNALASVLGLERLPDFCVQKLPQIRADLNVMAQDGTLEGPDFDVTVKETRSWLFGLWYKHRVFKINEYDEFLDLHTNSDYFWDIEKGKDVLRFRLKYLEKSPEWKAYLEASSPFFERPYYEYDYSYLYKSGMDQNWLRMRRRKNNTAGLMVLGNLECWPTMYKLKCPENYVSLGYIFNEKNFDNYRCIHESLTVEANNLRPSSAPIYPMEAERYHKPSKANFIRFRNSNSASINREIPTDFFVIRDKDRRLIIDKKAIRFFRNLEGFPMDRGSKEATVQNSFDMYDETNIKLLRDKSSECKQPCDCGEVKEVSIRFREFTRITNFTFYGCCGENNLIVRIMSKIFPDNAATLPLRQFPGKNFHSADLMSITTNELLVSHKLNNTFRICDVLVFGQSVASIANVSVDYLDYDQYQNH